MRCKILLVHYMISTQFFLLVIPCTTLLLPCPTLLHYSIVTVHYSVAIPSQHWISTSTSHIQRFLQYSHIPSSFGYSYLILGRIVRYLLRCRCPRCSDCRVPSRECWQDHRGDNPILWGALFIHCFVLRLVRRICESASGASLKIRLTNLLFSSFPYLLHRLFLFI